MFSDLTWPHPLTYPTTQSPTHHPWVGLSLQIINLQTELNYLDSVNIFKIFSDLTWPHTSTQNQTIHPPMGERVSTNFRSSNRIEISWLVQVLLNFYWFLGVPPGGELMGMWGGERAPSTHTYTYIWHYREFPGIPPMGDVCAYVCACMCVHVTCGGVPQPPPTPYDHPYPQSHREPKSPKFNKSWTNPENSNLFEDSLPLNTPALI